MKIDLEPGSKPKLGPIYKLCVLELTEMKKQIEEALANGSSDQVSAHGEAQYCSRKRKTVASACVLTTGHFNKETIRNQVPLPRIR